MKALKYGILLIGAAACAPVAAADKQIPVDKRIAVPAGAPVRVVNVAGEISIAGGARQDLHVTGSMESGVERIDVTNVDGTIVVKVVLPRVLVRRNAAARLNIAMPAGSRLETSTVSADQEVQGIDAPVALVSVSGNVEASGLGGDVQAKTVSGDLTLQGTARTANWRLTTVSGSIVLLRGAGTVEMSSVSGDADLQLEQVNSVRGRSTSGNASIRGRLVRGAELQFETVSGDLDMNLESDAGLQIDASSFSGEITTCFGEKGKPTSDYGPGEALATRRGDGGAKLKLKSLSGDLRICDRR
jgi:DUF4097 and DUF4098 domain-containing protein YvlB